MIDVALIPAAGRGTRMLDASRIISKPLISILDRPAVQWVMDEAIDAGIGEIVLVVGLRSLLFEQFGSTYRGAKLVYVEQREARGLGHAVSMGRNVISDRSFLCLLSDNIAYPNTNPSRELVSTFAGSSVLGLREIPDDLLESYGVAVLGPDGRRVLQTIEKPGMGSPSNLGLVGRYIFSADIFELLEASEPGYGGEIQLTDSIDALCQMDVVAGCLLQADLLDTGTPAKLLEAVTTLGWHSETYGEQYRAFLARSEFTS